MAQSVRLRCIIGYTGSVAGVSGRRWEVAASAGAHCVRVTFGQDGKPFYINGPRDDTFGIMAKLRQTVDDENFDYLVQFPSTAH